MNIDERLLSFWGKLDSDLVSSHPLLYHLIDTMEVASLLWDRGFLGYHFKNIFSETFGEENSKGFYQFLAALHDLGKISPEFQLGPSYGRTLTSIIERISETGLVSTSKTFVRNEHEKEGAYFIQNKLLKFLDDNGFVSSSSLQSLNQLAVATSIFEGEVISSSFLKCKPRMNSVAVRNPSITKEWDALIEKFLFVLLDYCNIKPHSLKFNLLPGDCFHILAGSIKIADWLASNPDYFKFSAERDVDRYSIASRKAANHAINAIKLYAPKVKDLGLRGIVGFEPNVLQETVYDHALSSSRKSLTIIQTETGGGKTLAALSAVTAKMKKFGLYGVYFALPTKITSLQAFKETASWGERVFISDKIRPHLEMSGWNNLNVADFSPTVNYWLRGPRRNLLSPIEVGTVDQLFQSFQARKYVMAKIAGINNRIVVFDEVHSYDHFQREIFKRSLEWLSSLEVPVIILTATLNREFKKEILETYSHSTFSEDLYSTDLNISTVDDGVYVNGRIDFLPDNRAKKVVVDLDKNNNSNIQLKNICDVLNNFYHCDNHGVVGIIKNTVKDSIDTFRFVEKYCVDNNLDVNLVLLHSRFTVADREAHENRVLRLSGKDNKDRRSEEKLSIVIGTQLLEQSLDIDFDYMITDVCPIESFVQRVGRLHRWDTWRPSWGVDPVVKVLAGENLVDTLKREKLYSRSSVRNFIATNVLFDNISVINFPSDTKRLISKVYAFNDFDRDEFKKYIEREDTMIEERLFKSRRFLLAAPSCESAWNNLEIAPEAVTRVINNSYSVAIVAECKEIDGVIKYRPYNSDKFFDSSEFGDRAFMNSSLSIPAYWDSKFEKVVEFGDLNKSLDGWVMNNTFIVYDDRFGADFCGDAYEL